MSSGDGREARVSLTLEQAVSAFGKSTTAKLSNAAISGAPEDQLRGPLEKLVADLALIAGYPPGACAMVGETTLAEDRTRPDYAVTIRNALVGFIEVKAPGKGANPRLFRDKHDKSQWERLKSLPNLLYTDGNSFGLWRDGERVGDVVRLIGDVESSGTALFSPPALTALLEDFFSWQPISPRKSQAPRGGQRAPVPAAARGGGGAVAPGPYRPDGSRQGLAQAAVPGCQRREFRGRLCPGGHLRPSDRACR